MTGARVFGFRGLLGVWARGARLCGLGAVWGAMGFLCEGA